VLVAFDRVMVPITTTLTTFYTAPADRATVVIGCQVSNITQDVPNVRIDLALKTPTRTLYLIRNVRLPIDTALAPVLGRVILQPSDELQIRCSRADSAEVMLSVSVVEGVGIPSGT
jgi:hypothetical protein